MPLLMELTYSLHHHLEGPYIIVTFRNLTIHDTLLEVYSRKLFHNVYMVGVPTLFEISLPLFVFVLETPLPFFALVLVYQPFHLGANLNMVQNTHVLNH